MGVDKGFKLKLKRAKTLAVREFGISEAKAKLKVEMADGGVYIYKLPIGRFEATIENDWYNRNGMIRMEVSSGHEERMNFYFDPWTLEENYDAEMRDREEEKMERCAACRFWAAEERKAEEAAVLTAMPFIEKHLNRME